MRWSPIEWTAPNGWAICVIAAYLDGSWDSHGGRDAQRFVGLACVAAYAPLWTDEFRPLWSDLVRDNGGEPIHAAEMFASGDPAQIALLDRAVAIVSGLRRDAFHAFGCVVDLADYRRAQPDCQELIAPRLAPEPVKPKTAEAVCVDWCVGRLFGSAWYDRTKPKPHDIELAVDRDEQFLKWIYRVYTAEASKRPWWAQRGRRSGDPRVAGIYPSNKEDRPEIQAADIIAWVCNRHHTKGDVPDWYAAITKDRTADFKFYNYKRLLVGYSDAETINRRHDEGAFRDGA